MSELWDFTAPEDDADDAGRPSDLELDRLYAGELEPGAAARLRARIEASPEDRARFEALDRHFDDIDGVDPRRMLAAIRREADAPDTATRRVIALWRLLAAGLVAVIAAAVLFVGLGPGTPTHGPDGRRLAPGDPDLVTVKGGPALFVERRGADGVGRPLDPRAAVAAGDTLKFAVTLPWRATVRIMGVEAGGERYDVFPLEGGPSPALGPGQRIPLDGAVTLDDSPGAETLYLVACAPDVEPGQCRLGGAEPLCPEGCRTDTFVLSKTP